MPALSGRAAERYLAGRGGLPMARKSRDPNVAFVVEFEDVRTAFMSSVKTIIAVLALILLFSNPSQAAKSTRDRVLSQHEAACKAQARKQYPGLKFIKRREY